MKTRPTALTLCLLSLFAAMPARAGDGGEDATIRKAIETRYAILAEASDKNDGMKAMALFGKGYTNTDLAGTVRPGSVVAGAIAGAIPDDSRKSKITVTSFKWEGEKAVVGQTYDLTTLRAAEKDKKIQVHMVTTSTDTWVKEDDQWVLQKSVAETGDVYMNDIHVGHRVRGEALPAAAAAKETPAAQEDKPADKPAGKKEDKPAEKPAQKPAKN